MLASTTPQTDLATVLVRLSRECGVGVEHLRAEQLVREAQSAWPGEKDQQWSRWLLETCECLSLRARVVDLTIADALDLSQDGALLVGGYHPELGVQVLLGADANYVEVATGELDDRNRIATRELAEILGIEQVGDGAELKETTRWLVVEHPELIDAEDARHLHHKPMKRLLRIIRPEWPDIWMILVFAFFAGVLNLATPIAVEALVNTVSFGQQLQPVIVLAALLFGFLAFAALMKAMQTYVAEIIQRRLFARVAADLAYRLPRTDSAQFNSQYGPELVNRFLDVVTLQKVVAALLLDGVSIVLATLVGMSVLAFYHPWLLGFDVLLLLMVVAGLVVLGRGGIGSGIYESKMKYRLTSWFEDIMRCQAGFKLGGGADFAIDRANQITADYLSSRRSHFTILFRQISFTLALQAFAGTVLLGGGGWLVIQGQLSLGQLVAAELIVTTILSSLAKLGKHLEGFYDVVAAVDKLGYLFDLPVERHDGLLGTSGQEDNERREANPPIDRRKDDDRVGVEVVFSEVRCRGAGWMADVGLSGHIEAGEKISVYGPASCGKTMLARLLNGQEISTSGHVEVGGSDPRDMRPDVLRSMVALAGEIELFCGTIADNVRLGRPDISTSDVRAALDEVGLLDDVLRLADGIDTLLNPSGSPFSASQQKLLMIARAIAGRPRLLVIDGLLDALPDIDLEIAFEHLTSAERGWTLIVTTGRRALAERFARTIYLQDTLFVDVSPSTKTPSDGGPQS